MIKSTPALSYPTSCLKSWLSGLIPGKGVRNVSFLCDTGKVAIQKRELWSFCVISLPARESKRQQHRNDTKEWENFWGITAQGELFAVCVVLMLPNSGTAMTILYFDPPQTHAELLLSQHSLPFRSSGVGLM